MKICIFEPHPDDLLFGPGPILFDWITQNNQIHVITVTDGRACYRFVQDESSDGIAEIPEDNVAEMRITEAKKAIDFLGIPLKNHHLLKFHDADGQKYVKEAIKKVKPIIKDADRIVLPSDNNSHEDHQATHDIAIKASKDLKLKKAEFWVYFIPTYGKWNDDSRNKQIEIEISDDLREKLLEWLQIYQSQKKLKYTWKMFTKFIEVIDKVTYGIFNYKDMGQYYNF